MEEKNDVYETGGEITAGSETSSSDGGSGEKRPQRYKIYDRIADNVSLNTINIIIIVVAVLLIGFVIYGIATGNPPA